MTTMIAPVLHPEPELDPLSEHAEARQSGHLTMAAGRTLSDPGMTAWHDDIACLQRIQRMEAVGRLAVCCAHEFNNTLTVISGFVEVLWDRMATTEDQEEIREIRNAIERAAGLAQQLLSLGRTRHTPVHAVDLARVVHGMSHALTCLAGTRVHLEMTLSDQRCPVQVNAQEIEQIVLNLVINGYDAICTTGQIHVCVTPVDFPIEFVHANGCIPPGRFVCLTVRDTGTGIDVVTQQRMFEPFFTTKDPGKGTGLGMAIVWDILQRTHGHIVVNSTPGQGSRFDLYWPCSG